MKSLAAILAALLIFDCACTSYRQVPPRDIKDSRDKIYSATRRNGEVVTFKPIVCKSEEYGDPGYAIFGYYVWSTRSVHGVSTRGEEVSLPVDSLRSVCVERFNTKRVVVVTSVITVISAGIFMAWLLTADWTY